MDLSKLTPLGRAEKILEEEIQEFKAEDKQKYDEALANYRKTKTAHLAVKILLYAGIITSFTATFGIDAGIISRISSYIGVTILIILYTALTYLTAIQRETFLVRREILISQA